MLESSFITEYKADRRESYIFCVYHKYIANCRPKSGKDREKETTKLRQFSFIPRHNAHSAQSEASVKLDLEHGEFDFRLNVHLLSEQRKPVICLEVLRQICGTCQFLVYYIKYN